MSLRFRTSTKQLYRVTEQLVQNLLLTSKQKFRFGLAWPGDWRGQSRTFPPEVNRRFCTSYSVTLYFKPAVKLFATVLSRLKTEINIIASRELRLYLGNRDRVGSHPLSNNLTTVKRIPSHSHSHYQIILLWKLLEMKFLLLLFSITLFEMLVTILDIFCNITLLPLIKILLHSDG